MDQPTFIHPSQRYRLYFDETGNGDLKASKKDENQRYLSLTGIISRQDIHDVDITTKLNDFKADIFGEANRYIVLHRRDIIDKVGVFALLNDNALRARFDSGFAALIKELPGPALTVSIDKLAHLEKYKVWQFNPYHYALTCLVERFVNWLDSKGYVGDVMGEARGPWHDMQLRRAFTRFHRNGTNFVSSKVVQRRLISKELMLREKTANIAGLQISDLLAHPCHRAYKFEKLKLAQPADYGTQLAKLVYQLYRKQRFSGRVEGYGRKWLP